MIFTIENLNLASVKLDLFFISTYKRIVFQHLQGGLCNEFDSFSYELSCEIKIFESAF